MPLRNMSTKPQGISFGRHEIDHLQWSKLGYLPELKDEP